MRWFWLGHSGCSDKTLGEIAYNAYCSNATGRPYVLLRTGLPFVDLPLTQAAAWQAAGEAAGISLARDLRAAIEGRR